MTHIVTVPLSALSLSHHNIRKTRRASDIDALVASIGAEGLLQNLIVVRIPPDEAQRAERFDVIDGGQRLRAMQLLAERGAIDIEHPVPVEVRALESATEIGLAANTIRTAMHPHDEFVAFRDLAAAGMPTEDIAARFGVAPIVVERRLKLANVAPEILHAFREDLLSLEVMQAFALTDDWAVQRRIFEEATSNGRRINAHQVRGAIAQREVPSTDKRVTFVGLANYEAAGGAVRRDLFDDTGGGYLLDENLLDQLVEERLQREARALEAEGWKFVRIDRDGEGWKFRNQCDRTEPKREKRVLGEAENARLKEISDRVAVLSRVIDEADDNEDDSVSGEEYDRWTEERDALEHESGALTAGIEVYSDRQKAKAGCMIFVDFDGSLEVVRGLIPREGTKADAAAQQERTVFEPGTAPPKVPTLAESMIRRLTAHKTLALQSALLARRDLALKALAHGLLLNLLYGHDYDTRSPLAVTAKDQHQELSRFQFADLDASPVMRKLDADIEELRTTLGVPSQRAKLWPWLLQQNEDTVTALLGLVAVVSLDATTGSLGDHPSDALAAALDIDFADYWQATPEAFTNLVPKGLAFEALAECVPDETQRAGIASTLAGQGKAFVASEIARHLVQLRWLPKPLRRPGYKPGVKAAPAPTDDVETLGRVVAAKKKAKTKPKTNAKAAAKRPAAKKKAAARKTKPTRKTKSV
jgi:ParB family chromosome partitioning protein